MDFTLTPLQSRVLGCLLEKEVTVPATYPMTLKAVVTACNQTSGRDPILDLSEVEVNTALDELRGLQLTRLVYPRQAARSTKYRQVAHDVLQLEAPERAVLTMLMLRGPQTPGELRSRSDRLHAFGSVEEVSETLGGLASRDDPLVVELARRAGHKETRWAHLLGGAPAEQGEVVDPTAETVPEPVPSPPEPGPEHGELAALVGTWKGEGTGHYPTIEPFEYHEEIEIRAVPGKALLSYRSATRHKRDGRGLHAESGWFRIVGPGAVELVVAQGPGIVEVAEGLVEAEARAVDVVLASTLVAGSSTSVEVTATERRYRVEADTLSYDLWMSASGQTLTHHLNATLHRSHYRSRP